MNKLKMQTIDGVQDNIAKIAELFPECITEVVEDSQNTPPRWKKEHKTGY